MAGTGTCWKVVRFNEPRVSLVEVGEVLAECEMRLLVRAEDCVEHDEWLVVCVVFSFALLWMVNRLAE